MKEVAGTDKSFAAVDEVISYEDRSVWGEHPINVPGEIVVQTETSLSNAEEIAYELTQGNAQKVIENLHAINKKATAMARGARQMAIHTWDEHPEIVIGTGIAIAGTIFITPRIISKFRKD